MPPKVRKRPAGAMAPERPAQYEAPEHDPTPETSAQWAHPPEGSTFPSRPWANHIVTTLVRHGHLPGRVAERKAVSLQVWSDCSGINTEMLALKELGRSLGQVINAEVSWDLYFTCDSDAKSIQFAHDNFHPKHVGVDMEQRNLDPLLNNFWCAVCNRNHDIPRSGIDLYVGTYPCAPWSRRGKRTGFDHPGTTPFHIGVGTIAVMRPALWIIELGELPDQTAMDQITSIIAGKLNVQGTVSYTMQPLRNLTPSWSGFPIRRTLFVFCFGWRADMGAASELNKALSTFIEFPLAVDLSYRGLLGMSGAIDWSRVGQYPSGHELSQIMSSNCRCSANPLTICAQHPCKCNHCGDDGTSCTWRTMAMDYVTKQGILPQANDVGTMTYVQVLEMAGRKAPTQPRVRVLLNVLALLPQARPLTDTLMVGDTSQNLHFMSLATDGLVPTLTMSSAMWCLSAGRHLEVWELAALMAVPVTDVTFAGQSEAWFRGRLGLAVHVGNFGLALLALHATPLMKLLT